MLSSYVKARAEVSLRRKSTALTLSLRSIIIGGL
eukprot:CAMPEP_0194692608 /NCGR_PEP_ID=MMETSP0295-20121207/19917_1 /TAXON_ID=39354 /ORGANISM="Heterosigma akashiwo, Strain CCMP2393" /LENGTH=33 /DNA_ID= /DNA_START= /DNA_END= /DNA_ORIENTATION=